MDNVWVKIDLAAIKRNFRTARKYTEHKAFICAVIKDNAYGHGLLPLAKTLIEEGAEYLGVADLSDADKLRSAGIKLPILNLVGILEKDAPDAVSLGVSQAVSELTVPLAMEKAARKQKKAAKVHIEIDSGMGRLGVLPKDFPSIYNGLKDLENVFLEGVFSHLPSADTDLKATLSHAAHFLQTVKDVPAGVIRHCANSPAVINCPKLALDMVRPGLMLYGLYPFATEKKVRLEPALSLHTRVILVKKMQKGSRISYNSTYRLKKDSFVAAIPAGYGDGFNRLLSNKGEVLIRGKRYPVAGRVCMDITMIDLGNDGRIRPGELVTLIGSDGKEKITAEEIAKKCGTISYEVVCSINKEIKREYK